MNVSGIKNFDFLLILQSLSDFFLVPIQIRESLAV